MKLETNRNYKIAKSNPKQAETKMNRDDAPHAFWRPEPNFHFAEKTPYFELNVSISHNIEKKKKHHHNQDY